MPATHIKHALDPALEYWPAAHGTHISDEDAHRLAEYFPSTQLVQTEDPAESLKVPASHGRQVDKDVAPWLEEKVPSLHGEQVAASPEASK